MIGIPAVVRDFKVANRLPDEAELWYDTGRMRGSEGKRAQCVIVAKERRERSQGLKRHYVLLVTSKQAMGSGGRRAYERIGAGYMPGKYISLDNAGAEG